MNRMLLVLLFLIAAFVVEGQGTVLQGQIVDEAKEGVIGASVKLLRQDTLIRGILSDFDGNYRCRVEAGRYNLEVVGSGFDIKRIEAFDVLPGKVNLLNVSLSASPVVEMRICFWPYPPLIEKYNTSGGRIFTAEQIRRMY